MSKVSDLKNALTELFRKGTEVGYTETEIDEFLEDIDYHTLLQAVWDSAETVYAFRADGRHELSLNYRGAELFQQRATLLYEDMGEGFAGVVTAVRSMELWLLEDMGFAIVANFSLEAGNCEYVTEYRVYKGSDWTDSELDLDFEELVADLAKMCQPYYGYAAPFMSCNFRNEVKYKGNPLWGQPFSAIRKSNSTPSACPVAKTVPLCSC